MILRSSAPELTNNITQKGRAFVGDWSGTVVKFGPDERPGILPRRPVCRGGASVVRRNAAINRIEDSDADVFKEASAQIHSGAGDDCKASTARHHRSWGEERCGLKASSRHRDASIADRNDDRRNDEGNGLAAAFGAWFPRRCRAQKAEAEAQFEEDRRQPGLPRRWRG